MIRLFIFCELILIVSSLSDASGVRSDAGNVQEFDLQAYPALENSQPYRNGSTSGRYGSMSSQWDREENPLSENDLTSDQMSLGGNKPQREYMCGRASATSKNRDLLLRDQNYQASISRGRYRPLEIRMPRIIGGDETQPGEFPWAVSVKLNGQPICGGSLIDRNWILTAAHCVVGYNPKNLTVRLGAYRIKDTSEMQTVDVPVGMFIVHKDYSIPRPFSNDIALLKMADSVEFSDYIIPICLPTEDQVTTSTSSQIVNDYSNRLDSFKEASDSGGIVISTKMSDNDIAKCFNKLEQNYLQSIGLGTLTESSTPPAPPKPANKPAQVAMAPVPSLPLPPLPAPPVAALNHLFTHDSLMSNPILNAAAQSALGDKYSTTASYSSPSKVKFYSQSTAQSNWHQGDTSTGALDQTKYVHFGPAWAYRNSAESDLGAAEGPRRKPPKLSRLPISKELLHEIQSIGAGPMPSLNLALQQGDILAMTNDLTQSNAATISLKEKLTAQQAFKKNSALQTRGQLSSVAEVDDPVKYSGLSGTVVGWGWVRETDGDDSQVNHKGYPSVTLQKVRLPILRNNVCEAWFQSQSKKITLLPSQFCAGFNSGGKDACRVSRVALGRSFYACIGQLTVILSTNTRATQEVP